MTRKNALFPAIALATAALITPQTSHALNFIFNEIGNTPLDSRARAGFEEAGAIWSSLFSDDINVRIDIGFSTLGAGVLGQAGSAQFVGSYDLIRSGLQNDITTGFDALAVSNLQNNSNLNVMIDGVASNAGNVNNNTMRVNSANLKALGLLGDVFSGQLITDAIIQFNSDFNFDFDISDGINGFDFVGVALHEIGHALGFTSGVYIIDRNGFNPNTATATVLDLFRYTTESNDAGAVDWSPGGTPYFSLTGDALFLEGQQDTALFSTGSFTGDGNQASHWKDNLGIGILDPTFSQNEIGQISTFDLVALDAIGFDLILQQEPPGAGPTPTVPLPSSLSLSIIGLIGLRIMSKRRQS